MTDWLLGTLLATSGLIVLVLLIREPVRRHFGARVAYGLWLIPAARLLMPTLTQTVERSIPQGAPINPLATSMVAEPMLLAATAAPEPTLLDQLGGWSTIVPVVWLGVALTLFLSRMIAFRRERSAILADSVEIARIDTIRLVRSDQVSGPLAFGIFDRVIAVPADFDRLYAPHERRLALDHELAHHRSSDLITNLFAFVLLCLQWFNPLAWVAHAAFRFDQEAACDARVLDKVHGHDRADYGRAIAKAASGRALLFASALDRRNTLHRRLKSMLTNPTTGRRMTGRVMVLATIAVVLPMTATRAINYVDIPMPMASQASLVPAAPVVPAVAAAAPVAPVAPATPVHPTTSLNFDDDGTIHINGKSKHWRDLTPEEKAEVRRSIAEARAELARNPVNRDEIMREVREALNEAKFDKEGLRRDLAEARADIAEAMREIDAHAVEIRRSGHDPEQIKATVRASLKSVEAIDIEAITRNALASVDERQIEASIEAAEAGVRKAEAALDRIEALDREDPE